MRPRQSVGTAVGLCRAVAYTRVSTEEQATEGVSLEAQETRIRAHCLAHGLELTAVYRDAGVSGATPLERRPAGRDLANAIETGEPMVVIAVKLDRCFRSASDCLQTVERWVGLGVALHLLDMAVDTRSAAGKMFLTLAAAFAELELNSIRERTRAALRHKMARGDLVHAPALGFCAVQGRAEIDTRELEVARHVLELCEQDVPFAVIAARLNAESVRTKRGGRWHASTVHKIWSRRSVYASAGTCRERFESGGTAYARYPAV